MILLTQVGESTERAMALEEGADDYLNKPFDPHELVARIRAVLRRARPGQPPLAAAQRLACGDLVLDRRSRRAYIGSQEAEPDPQGGGPARVHDDPSRRTAHPRPAARTPSGAGTIRPARAPWTRASPNCGARWAMTPPTRSTLRPCPGRAIALWARWRPCHEMAGWVTRPGPGRRGAGDRDACAGRRPRCAIPILYLRGDLGTVAVLAGLGTVTWLAAGLVTLGMVGRAAREQHIADSTQSQARGGAAPVSAAPGPRTQEPAHGDPGRPGQRGRRLDARPSSSRRPWTSVQAQALRLSRLTADLRKLAELETRPLERAPVDVAELLQEVLSVAQEQPQAATQRS